jgi:uncharacterized membrane protein YgcG
MLGGGANYGVSSARLEAGGVGKRGKGSWGGWLAELMPFAYPIILGSLETLVQMCMKAASSMVFLSFEGQSQLCHATFWVSALLLVLLTLLVIVWLRKGLSHLEASRLLPVEYGTVTSTSILGGLILYQEHRYVSRLHICFMMVGILLILLGCGLVGRRKTIKKRFDPGYRFNHEALPHIRAQMAARISFDLFQLQSIQSAEGRERRSRAASASGSAALELPSLGGGGGCGGGGGGLDERMPKGQARSALCADVSSTSAGEPFGERTRGTRAAAGRGARSGRGGRPPGEVTIQMQLAGPDSESATESGLPCCTSPGSSSRACYTAPAADQRV